MTLSGTLAKKNWPWLFSNTFPARAGNDFSVQIRSETKSICFDNDDLSTHFRMGLKLYFISARCSSFSFKHGGLTLNSERTNNMNGKMCKSFCLLVNQAVYTLYILLLELISSKNIVI